MYEPLYDAWYAISTRSAPRGRDLRSSHCRSPPGSGFSGSAPWIASTTRHSDTERRLKYERGALRRTGDHDGLTGPDEEDAGHRGQKTVQTMFEVRLISGIQDRTMEVHDCFVVLYCCSYPSSSSLADYSKI